MSEKLRSFAGQNRLLISIIALGLIVNLVYFLKLDSFLWDLSVYQGAVDVFNSGGNPYFDLEGLKFVYTPFVLLAFAGLGSHLSVVFGTIYALALGFFILSRRGFELVTASLFSTIVFWKQEFLAYAITTGNLTAFAHFAIIASASFNVPLLFLVLTCLLSVIKPYFAAYFLLGLVIWWKEAGIFLKTAIFFAVSVATSALQALTHQALFVDFLNSLSAQALGDDNMRDVGIGFYRFFSAYVSKEVALFGHIAVLSLLSVCLVVIFKALKKKIDAELWQTLVFYTALILVTLSNPRLKVYDYWIVPAASLLVIYLIATNFALLRPKLQTFALPVLVFATPVLFAILSSFYDKVFGVYLPAAIAFVLLARLALGEARHKPRDEGAMPKRT